jgi:hypothetical protein
MTNNNKETIELKKQIVELTSENNLLRELNSVASAFLIAANVYDAAASDMISIKKKINKFYADVDNSEIRTQSSKITKAKKEAAKKKSAVVAKKSK